MFPPLEVRLQGLSSKSRYIIYMDVIPVGNLRYRYTHQNSQWTAMESKEMTTAAKLVYIHPESPASGQLWSCMKRVSFHEVKLTNNKNPVIRGQISLQSMHKYQPRILVLEVSELSDVNVKNVKKYVMENHESSIPFVFPSTSFITVTAYQNPEITRLKMINNPFAHWPNIRNRDEETIPGVNEGDMIANSSGLRHFCCRLHYKTAPLKIVYHSMES